jgi:hypothetical protein
MKRLMVLAAVLLMSMMFVLTTFADVIVEKNFDLDLKCYGNGIVSDDDMNKTGMVFTFTTADLIAKLGLAKNIVFSRHAQIICQEYFEGDASSTMPTDPSNIKGIVRDGTLEEDVSIYFGQILSNKVGKVNFVEGKGGSFTTYNIVVQGFQTDNGEHYWLEGLMKNDGTFLKAPYAYVTLYNSSANINGYLSLGDGKNGIITYVITGTLKFTNAKIVPVN